MKNKTIIFIIPMFSSFKLFLLDLAEELIRREANLILITKNTNNEKVKGLKIYDLDIPRGLNILKYFKVAYQIRKLLKKEKPNILHVHFTPAILVTRLSFAIKNINSFAMAHGLLFNSRKSKLLKYFYLAIEYFAYTPYDTLYLINNKDINDGLPYFKNQKK